MFKNKKGSAVDTKPVSTVKETKEVQLSKDQRVSVNGVALINLIGIAERASYTIPYMQVQTIISDVKNDIALIEEKTENDVKA